MAKTSPALPAVMLNAVGCSDARSVTVNYRVPTEPTGLEATRSLGAVDLRWDLISATDITHYNISRSDVTNTLILESTVSSSVATYTDTTPVAGNSYNYEVRACNEVGCSDAASRLVNYRVPAEPTDLTATLLPDSVNLQWTSVTGSITHYNISRNGEVIAAPATISAIAPSYTDNTPVVDNDYNYEVRACNDVGCSAPASASAHFFYDNLDYDGDGTSNRDDVDLDGDGLIEIYTAQDLNAIRNNLAGTGLDINGSGSVSKGCGGAIDAFGEPSTACFGYEIMADIDLNDLSKDLTGSNWDPIGSCGNSECDAAMSQLFAANFEGNNYTINNLIINTANKAVHGIGLFAAVGSGRSITNVHLRNVTITALSSHLVGGLIGTGDNVIVKSSSVIANQISGIRRIGGLIGIGRNALIDSSSVNVTLISGTFEIGGLIGWADDATILSSSVIVGTIEGTGGDTGGLLGQGIRSTVTDSSAIVDQIIGSSTNFFSRNYGGMIGNAERVSVNSSFAIVNQITASLSSRVGGLIGYGLQATVISSSANVTGIIASNNVGGLLGNGNGAMISYSSANVNEINANNNLGGLVGYGSQGRISSSSAMVNQIKGKENLGGLVGHASTVTFYFPSPARISSSSAIVNQINGVSQVGGLVGAGTSAIINSSLALTRSINATSNIGGLVGSSNFATITDSYWNSEILSFLPNPATNTDGTGQLTDTLQMPTNTTGFANSIYATWANAYCNPTTGEYMTVADGDSEPDGFQRAWNLGGTNDYPVLNCFPNFTPAQQRAAITKVLVPLPTP